MPLEDRGRAQIPRDVSPRVTIPIGSTPSTRPRGNAPLTVPTFPTLNDGNWTLYTVITPGDAERARRRGKGNAAAQMQVGGPGTLIPVHYGLRRIGARIAIVLSYAGALVFLCVWGEGEIDAVEQLCVNDENAPSGVTATHYLGTAGQTADPTLVAAFAALGQPYTDTLPNIAYSVVSVYPKKNAGFPQFSARIRGRKVATSDGGTPTYSTTPAYIIADFITNTRYGLKAAVNWSDVAALASRNTGTVGSPAEARHVLSVSIDSVASAEDWLLTLCDYAGAIPVKDGGTYRLFVDAPASSVATIAAADVVEGSLQWSTRAPHEAPTVIEVGYTDTTDNPWKDAQAFVYAPGADTGAVERRLSRVSRPGIQRYSEAYRYGVQLLNSYITSDLTIRWDAFDDAIAYLPGDVVTFDVSPFSAKAVRITAIQPRSPQIWSVTAVEYDAAKWSDAVVAGPSTVDTALPSPMSVPVVTGLAVVEDVYQAQTGRFLSRLVVSWTGPTLVSYMYLDGFTLQVSDGTTESVFELPYDATEFTTPALPENRNYEITVSAKSWLAVSDPATTSIVNNGKLALPSAPSGLTAYSVNGESRISWTLGADLDLMSTELRWSGQSGTWAAATPLTFVPAPERFYATSVIPSGARRIWAKSRDSVRTDASPDGQESADAVYFDWTADENNTSASVEYALSAGTLTNMALAVGGWVTSFGSDTFAALFPSALDTYTSALATYHASGTSSLVTADVDAGVSEACTVVVDGLEYEDLSGTGQVYIEHKVNSGDSWTRVNGTTASVTARYFRVGIEWTTTETGRVSVLGALRKIVDTTDRFVKDTIGNDFMAWMN